jgi:hypothetical protein
MNLHLALIWIILSMLLVSQGQMQQSLNVAPEVENAAIRIMEGMPTR